MTGDQAVALNGAFRWGGMSVSKRERGFAEEADLAVLGTIEARSGHRNGEDAPYKDDRGKKWHDAERIFWGNRLARVAESQR